MSVLPLFGGTDASGSVGSVSHGHAVTDTTMSDGAPRARNEIRPCAWTAPDGSVYDLTPLARVGQQEDYSVHIPHSNFAMLVNLCANTLRVPTRCAGPSNTRASVGFQWDTSNDASCWELGGLDTAQWDLLDENDPRKGVEVMFTGGTACGSGVARMVHFHMLCAESVGDEGPSFAWEAPICSYHVVWPTIHACPRPNRWPWARSFWWIVIIVVFVLAARAWRRSQDAGEPFGDAFLNEVVRLRGMCMEAAVGVASSIERTVSGFRSGHTSGAEGSLRGNRAVTKTMTTRKPYRDDDADDEEVSAIPYADDEDLAPMPLGDSI